MLGTAPVTYNLLRSCDNSAQIPCEAGADAPGKNMQEWIGARHS
jgi:hypothetical protein